MGILDRKIAIITGAGQGLGEGAAHAMTQEGACVALWGRTFEKVERVANDINKAGGRALAIKCDVSIRAEVDEALKKTIEAFGKLDSLATNHFAFAPYEMCIRDRCQRCEGVTQVMKTHLRQPCPL